MTAELANTIFSLLVDKAGAEESWRGQFVHATSKVLSGEFRFQGKFGFGGKLYFDEGECKIGYYKENRTPVLDDLEKQINRDLRHLIER